MYVTWLAESGAADRKHCAHVDAVGDLVCFPIASGPIPARPSPSSSGPAGRESPRRPGPGGGEVSTWDQPGSSEITSVVCIYSVVCVGCQIMSVSTPEQQDGLFTDPRSRDLKGKTFISFRFTY